MADPKYQNLPYIAADQPDMYETGDLPESDQNQFDAGEQQESVVETLMVDPKDAFKRFNKATVDTSGSNFSEDIVSGRSGYSVHYEVLPHHERGEESLLQKLQRLKCEVKELEDSARVFSADEVSPASIMNDVEMLQRQLDSFSSLSVASPDEHERTYSQLLAQLTAAPKKGSPKKGSASSGETVPNTTIYELSVVADSLQAAKEASIEARLAQLEDMVGGQSGNASVLGESIGGQSVVDSVALLSSKIGLLDDDKVDKLSARLQILLQTLSKVKDSGASTEVKNMDKINELYELVKKWDSTADSLPMIVDRLYTLQDLHQHAMEFSSCLKSLESAQEDLSKNLGTHSQLLTDVRQTFTANVDAVKANMESLDKRMSALKK